MLNNFQYVVEHSCKTLLPQYMGMYRLTLNNSEHYMIVMKNVFSPKHRVQTKYDLKVVFCYIVQ